MSHETSTVLGSCGLIVGLNIAPPPPGPSTSKSPGRTAKANPARQRKRITLWLILTILMLSFSFDIFRDHFRAKRLKCQRQNGRGPLSRNHTERRPLSHRNRRPWSSWRKRMAAFFIVARHDFVTGQTRECQCSFPSGFILLFLLEVRFLSVIQGCPITQARTEGSNEGPFYPCSYSAACCRSPVFQPFSLRPRHGPWHNSRDCCRSQRSRRRTSDRDRHRHLNRSQPPNKNECGWCL